MYCGNNRNIEDEHVMAVSRGGARIVPACRACNRSKSDKQLIVWLHWLKKNDLYRWNRIEKYNYGKRNDIAKKVQKIRDE
jgi:hypothetical protein